MRSALSQLALKQRKKDKEMAFATWLSAGMGDGIAPQLNGVRYFSFEELKKSTNNFSESNLLGEGAFGKVYKGHLTNGVVVAIKRAQGNIQGIREFKNEIELLSRVHHKNIVSLAGFCFQQGEKMLVYEYLSKGSLRDNLNGKNDIYLDWQKRLHIALDTARGLTYLHELANPQIIHRDVKSTNILLDENLNAKVIDLGISKLNHDKQEGHVSSQVKPTLVRVDTAVKGTYGYTDPEYLRTGQLSEKSDVYNFGMVMLELITAKRPNVLDKEHERTFVKEEVKTAIDMYDQDYYGLRDMIDPKIVNQARNTGFRKFVQLAFACLEESASDRPFMREVMKEMEIILQNDGNAITTSAAYFEKILTNQSTV